MAKQKRESGELVPIEPSRGLLPFDEIERWFQEALRRPFTQFDVPFWPGLRRSGDRDRVSTFVDMFDDGDNLVVKAELPGMTKEDIEVTLTDDVITIAGAKKKEEEVKEKDYYRLERSSGSFTRSFRLPVDVKTDKVKANFKDGVLEIKIPKTAEAKKKTKKIKIQ